MPYRKSSLHSLILLRSNIAGFPFHDYRQISLPHPPPPPAPPPYVNNTPARAPASVHKIEKTYSSSLFDRFSSRTSKESKRIRQERNTAKYTPYTKICLNIYKLSHLNGLGGKMSMSSL